jgi:hypothetical protein
MSDSRVAWKAKQEEERDEDEEDTDDNVRSFGRTSRPEINTW